MPIVIASDIVNIKPWIDALKKTAPSLEVKNIENVTDRNVLEFVLAWNYPHGLFRNYPRLKTISSMGAGVDHIMNDRHLPEKVKVVRIIDPLLSQDMYEFTLAVIMDRIRSLMHYSDNQRSKIWKKRLYLRISDINVGIMGVGRIGNHIALQLQTAGFRVHGWKRVEGAAKTCKMYHGPGQLKDFLAVSDILVCLLPLTHETEGILNRKNLETLPQNAWVINLGRGGHVVDDDLIGLIDSGHLDGASLDVFRDEPLPTDHPFWSHPSIQITPHIASLPSPHSVAPQIIENYRRTLENKPLLNLVDRERGY